MLVDYLFRSVAKNSKVTSCLTGHNQIYTTFARNDCYLGICINNWIETFTKCCGRLYSTSTPQRASTCTTIGYKATFSTIAVHCLLIISAFILISLGFLGVVPPICVTTQLHVRCMEVCERVIYMSL